MSSLANIPSEARCKQIVHYLLTNKTTCKVCDGKLAWKRGRDYGWCQACRIKIRPKAHMWFRGSKLSYRQMFMVLHCWQQRQSPGSARAATGLSYTTVRRWYWRFRWLVPLEKREQLLSGIVEVDEAWFGKRKFGGQTIVMGAIERTTRRLKLATVMDTERDSLEEFVKDHVAEGTLVVTDAKTGYNTLTSLGFRHESWNHSAGHFAGTNHIEANWSAMKRHLRKLYGCIPTKRLQFVLNEWEARHNQPELFTSPQIFLQRTLKLGFCD